MGKQRPDRDCTAIVESSWKVPGRKGDVPGARRFHPLSSRGGRRERDERLPRSVPAWILMTVCKNSITANGAFLRNCCLFGGALNLSSLLS